MKIDLKIREVLGSEIANLTHKPIEKQEKFLSEWTRNILNKNLKSENWLDRIPVMTQAIVTIETLDNNLPKLKGSIQEKREIIAHYFFKTLKLPITYIFSPLNHLHNKSFSEYQYLLFFLKLLSESAHAIDAQTIQASKKFLKFLDSHNKAVTEKVINSAFPYLAVINILLHTYLNYPELRLWMKKAEPILNKLPRGIGLKKEEQTILKRYLARVIKQVQSKSKKIEKYIK